ncbi:FecR domain-containing protein [Thermodesulfobacteriota bacterium]
MNLKSFTYTILGIFIFVVIPAFYIISDHLEKNYPGNDFSISDISGVAAVRYNVNRPIESADRKHRKQTVYRKISEWIPLEKGTKLGSGGLIKVGKHAHVDIMLDKGSAIRIKENSRLEIEKDAKKPNLVNASLHAGKILCRITQKQDKNETLRVLTPTAIARVRGTSFLIDYNPSLKITKVQVKNGVVNLKSLKNPALQADISGGKRIQYTPYNRSPLIAEVTAQGKRELQETEDLKIDITMMEQWDQAFNFIIASPIYRKALVAITKYEMKVFVRSIRYFAPLRWHNRVPNSLSEVELEEGDYQDPWNTDYFYDKIGPRQAILISAGPDEIVHTHDDIFMSINL